MRIIRNETLIKLERVFGTLIFFDLAMNIECVICLENLQPAEDISNTPCGHVFHHPCVAKWFQRSSTCPECRKKVHGKKLHKIYFNFVDENTIMEELTSMLESEIKTLKHQLTVKEEIITQGVENEKMLSEENKSLQNQMNNLTAEMEGNLEQLEDIKSNLQNADDELTEIIKNLRISLKGFVTKKSSDAPNSTDLRTVNSVQNIEKRNKVCKLKD